MSMEATELLSRKTVKHLLMRARNTRVIELRDDRWPELMRVNQRTLEELLTDGDPLEVQTLDFEGNAFLGVPILIDPRLDNGQVAFDWPKKPKATV